MFGQMEKDGWGLMEWPRHTLLRSPRSSSYLFVPFSPSFILPSIKALIGFENVSTTQTQRLAFCVSNPKINPR